MLLSSVIIVLREVLEAALLISVLLALSRQQKFTAEWIYIALAVGISGATLYAQNFQQISSWFDYVGQEVVNALLHLSIFISLLLFSILYQLKPATFNHSKKSLISIAVALAIIREGTEIFIYFSGYFQQPDKLASVSIGGILGAGIGISVGALLYNALAYSITQSVQRVAFALVSLFAANMLSQAVLMLIQADWLPAQKALWDTSGWLSESSIIGQLLYAIIGYEAKPTGIQVSAYLGGLLLILCLPTLIKVSWSRDD